MPYSTIPQNKTNRDRKLSGVTVCQRSFFEPVSFRQLLQWNQYWWMRMETSWLCFRCADERVSGLATWNTIQIYSISKISILSARGLFQIQPHRLLSTGDRLSEGLRYTHVYREIAESIVILRLGFTRRVDMMQETNHQSLTWAAVLVLLLLLLYVLLYPQLVWLAVNVVHFEPSQSK